MEAKALVFVYSDPTDLGHQVREAVEHDLTQMNLGVAALPVAAPEHAMPRLRYDGFGKRLIAENYSTTVRADQFMLEIPDGNYRIDYDDEPVDLLPQADARWRVILFRETQTVFLD
jgi:hypothetical protein